jgi:hypothetical protein
MELNNKPMEVPAKKGQEICIKIENRSGDAPRMYGRHFEATDLLVSRVSDLALVYFFFQVTVKTSNCGPHVNFELFLFFQKRLPSSKRILQKNEHESCIQILDLQIWSCSFLVHNSSKEAMKLASKGSKFP